MKLCDDSFTHNFVLVEDGISDAIRRLVEPLWPAAFPDVPERVLAREGGESPKPVLRDCRRREEADELVVGGHLTGGEQHWKLPLVIEPCRV